MPIPAYTPGYPPDGSSLGQTKAVIRNNLDGTFQTLAVDHIDNNGNPGSQPAGYHTVIHQVPQTSVNTASGYNQIFSGFPGTLIVNGLTTPAIPPLPYEQLYSLNSGGGLSQLTGAYQATNGYCWLGGVLMQWGIQALNATSPQNGTILFATANVNFPIACFNIQTSIISSSVYNANPTLGIVNGSITNTGFNYRYIGPVGASFPSFFWMAIGR